MTWSNAFLSPGVGLTLVSRDLQTSAHPSHGCVLNWTEAHPGCKRTDSILKGLSVLAVTGYGRCQISNKRLTSWKAAYGQPSLAVKRLPSTLQLHVKLQQPVNKQACQVVSFTEKTSRWVEQKSSQESDPRDSGESSSRHTPQAQPSSSGTQASAQPRAVRWLDREVKAGKVAEEVLVGSEDEPPPLRTDRIMRSYSMVAVRYDTVHRLPLTSRHFPTEISVLSALIH
jgi:hypothetical protein